jgi:hypothetical protein
VRGEALQGLVGKPESKRPLARPIVEGMIALRWIFRKWVMGVWAGLSWFKIEASGRHL